ncbi:putative serine/threonine-protein kinase [Carex littledalei]|uniref:non-specific serine/threonine protein kinase n=1 Tax=Carex littledalei TaxID=544730 RepID=A0A833VEA1_9POAL|nr:putative serine/threonine-protein kinase [Carex littledalei]
MSSSSSSPTLEEHLNRKTIVLGLQLWTVIGIAVGISIFSVLVVLAACISLRHRHQRHRSASKHRWSSTLPLTQIPTISKEIKEVTSNYLFEPSIDDINEHINESETAKIELGTGRSDSFRYMMADAAVHDITPPLAGLPEFSYLGWGHWFTLRDLELATNRFTKENIIGEGGYGIVYRGQLVNGEPVAVKKLLNNLGQAEKEFRVEVEAIGHVRHKNLVRLLGYCVEGTQRMLVYEYVNNGNLDQWLHGAMQHRGSLTWEARINILLGTAKALAYLHEAIEPKVVHRDIKSSNILIDDDFDAKVSDFGLAKLLGAGKSHVNTRVMGTFGYVAPEYANTGLLNEKSDVYSFGVVFLEAITGRDPVDYSRSPNEVNLVDWLKMMVANRRSEEVVDPTIEARPSTRELKKALLAALRCVDPDSNKRPCMGQVVRMLEPDGPNLHEDRRHRRHRAEMAGPEVQRENSDTDTSDNPDLKPIRSRNSRR